MEQTSLIQVLSGFQKERLRAFRRYFKGLYPRMAVAQQVLDYLSKWHLKGTGGNGFPPEKIEQEYSYARIFSGKEAINTKKLLDTLSDLFLKAEEYLAWRSLEKDKWLKNWLLALYYRHNEPKAFFWKKHKALEEELAADYLPSSSFYFRQLQTRYLSYFHPGKDQVVQKTAMPEIMSSLDAFYALEKLKYACEMANRMGITTDVYQPALIEQVLELVAQQPDWIQPVHTAYSLAYRMRYYHEKQHFNQLYPLFLEQESSFQEEDKEILLMLLVNFCAQEIRLGEDTFLKKAFVLFQLGIQQQLFIRSNIFPAARFINIVNTACALKEFEWVKDFTAKWILYIEKEHRRCTEYLSSAIISFEQGDFEKSMSCLLEIPSEAHLFFRLQAKALSMMSFFEIDASHSSLASQAGTFYHFLRRNDVLKADQKESYLNFISLFLQLVNHKTTPDKLLLRMEKMEYLAYRLWLKKKLKAAGK